MKKPYLTPEQIKLVEGIKELRMEEEAISKHATNAYFRDDPYEGLKHLPLLELVDALRVGYVKVPVYKVGEWVVTLDAEKQNRHTRQISVVHDTHLELERNPLQSWKFNQVRYANETEILKEETLRGFENIGRTEILLLEGDVVEYDGKYYVLRGNMPTVVISGKFMSLNHAYQMLMDARIDSIHPVEASHSFIKYNKGESSHEPTIHSK